MRKDVVFTKEKWEKVNPKNKELLQDYLVELKSRRKRQGTIEQYGYDGRMVLCYILTDMDNKCVLDFTKKDFRRISLWFTDTRKVSNARFNRVFALLRGMMEYAEDEEEYAYERNMARKIKGLEKNPIRDIYFLTDEQIMKLRKYLLDNHMYKQCVYLDMSYDSAGRLGEIHQVQKYDLLEQRFTNIVTGKRGKRFRLLYHDNTLESLKLYLEQRGDDSFDSLWVSGEGESRCTVSDNTLYAWCKQMTYILYELEDIFINFAPHSLRHSALQNYNQGSHYMCKRLGKEDGFTLEELQALANHESIDMTKSYLKPAQNDILESMFNIKIG